MGNETHRTTLEIKADARGLREARREISTAFDARVVESFNKGIVGVTKSQEKMIGVLKQVKAQSAGYKDLASAIREIGKVTAKSIEQIRKLNEEGKKGGFLASLLGGGIGGFVGAKSGSRGGYRMNLGLRPNAQAAQAAFQRQTSGMMAGAPLSTLTAGIPILGGAASLAEGQAMQSLQYQRLQMQALPSLAGTAGVAGRSIRARGGIRDAYLQSVGGYGGASATAAASAATAYAGSPEAEEMRRMGVIAQRRTIRERFTIGAGGAPNKMPTGLTGPEQAEMRRRSAGFNAAMNIEPEAFGEKLVREGAASRARLAMGESKANVDREIAKRESQASAAVRRKALSPFTSLGRGFGMTRMETMQAAGQAGQMVGGRMGEGTFEQILAGQVMGVDQGTAAQLFRAQRPGRGGSTGQGIDVLAHAIGEATAQGLEGSEVNEYLQQIAQFQAQAGQKGIILNTESLGAMATVLSRGTGLQGMRAATVAGGFAQAGQQIAQGGVSGPVQMMLMRAAGFKGQGGDDYVNALETLESVGAGGLGPQQMSTFLQDLYQQSGGAGGGGTQRLVMQRALKSIGMDVSLRETRGIVSGLQAGGGAATALAGVLGPGGGITAAGGRPGATGPKSGEDLARMMRETTKAFGSGLIQNAAVQDRLLEAGRKMLPTVLKLQGASARIADSLGDLEPILNKMVATPMDKVASAMANFISIGAEGLRDRTVD